MPTSLVSTGVQFPDSTIQTTAASGGGTITATASGSISSGAATVVNSNGTVSAGSATAATNFSGFANFVSGGGEYSTTTTPWFRSAVITKNGTIVTAATLSTGFIVIRAFRYINGNPVFGGTSVSQNWTNGYYVGTIAYDPVNDVVLVAFGGTGSNVRYTTVRPTAGGDITFLTAADIFVGGTANAVASTYDSFTGRITGVWKDTMNNAIYAFCGTVNTAGTFTSSTQTLFGGTGTVQGHPVSVTTDPATGKVFWFWVGIPGATSRNATAGGQLPTSGNTITSVSSSVSPFTDAAGANDYFGSMIFDTVSGQLMGFFNWQGFSQFYVMSASISGTTPTWGTTSGGSINLSANYSSLFFRGAVNNTLYIFCGNTSAGGVDIRTVSLSGTTVTLANTQNYTAVNGQNAVAYDSQNGVLYAFQAGGTGSRSASTSSATNLTSTVTPDNVIGVSSASYTNGQTATINVVSSTKGGYTGLTPGVKYYATSTGALSTNASSPAYIGVPISSTTLLVKG